MKANKKIVGTLLGISIISGLMAGCTVEEEVVNIEEVAPIETMKEEEKTGVLLDNEFCKITLKSKFRDDIDQETGYKMIMENKSQYTLSVFAENVSLGDTMVEQYDLYGEATGGKRAEFEFALCDYYEEDGTAPSLEELKNVQMTLIVYCDELEQSLVEEKIVID